MAPVVVLLFLAPLLFKANAWHVNYPVDCADIFFQNTSQPSGIYMIYPSSPRFSIPVYCDMETVGGPWTVIQRRMDATVNFFRPWDNYVYGFGDTHGEYWLGLEFIHQITQKKRQMLLVEMEDFLGNKATAQYSSFRVRPSSEGYRMYVSGFVNGGAGDSLSYHNGMRFSTFDKDQDATAGNCARLLMGGYWYRSCHYSNPNGPYLWGIGTHTHYGIIWRHWKGTGYSVKSISFKLHPV